MCLFSALVALKALNRRKKKQEKEETAATETKSR